MYNFNAIAPNTAGNTMGWAMGGTFCVYTVAAGSIPVLWVELDIYPAPTDVVANN